MKENILQPLEDRVIIKTIVENNQKTETGLYIPDTVRKEIAKGVVIAVGAGIYARDNGAFIENVLHEGDEVIYGANQGIEIDDREKIRIMREGDVIAVIKKAIEDN